jgi:hypothetical protein
MRVAAIAIDAITQITITICIQIQKRGSWPMAVRLGGR